MLKYDCDSTLETDAVKKFGVYLLLSKDMVYIGQSSDLAKRITQHIVGKDWWESVIILTTSNNRFNHADIDYLESVLIEKAFKLNSLDCNNKNKGNNPKISKFQHVSLDQFLEEAFFLMELIGITVFSEKKKSVRNKGLISTLDINTKLTIGKRAKSDALTYLSEQGIKLGKKVSYAIKSSDKDEFWINPRTSLLHIDWDIVLNDNAKQELIVMHIPADSLSLNSASSPGLVVRNDKEELIDLNISSVTFHDRKSDIDFSRYIIHKVRY